jgi:hypothetical protein
VISNSNGATTAAKQQQRSLKTTGIVLVPCGL